MAIKKKLEMLHLNKQLIKKIAASSRNQLRSAQNNQTELADQWCVVSNGTDEWGDVVPAFMPNQVYDAITI